MSKFNFVKRAVENGTVYCLDAEGNIYEMPKPGKYRKYATSKAVRNCLLKWRGILAKYQKLSGSS